MKLPIKINDYVAEKAAIYARDVQLMTDAGSRTPEQHYEDCYKGILGEGGVSQALGQISEWETERDKLKDAGTDGGVDVGGFNIKTKWHDDEFWLIPEGKSIPPNGYIGVEIDYRNRTLTRGVKFQHRDLGPVTLRNGTPAFGVKR